MCQVLTENVSSASISVNRKYVVLYSTVVLILTALFGPVCLNCKDSLVTVKLASPAFTRHSKLFQFNTVRLRLRLLTLPA